MTSLDRLLLTLKLTVVVCAPSHAETLVVEHTHTNYVEMAMKEGARYRHMRQEVVKNRKRRELFV